MNELRFLYETTVQRNVETPSIEKKTEDGQTVEIKRTLIDVKPVKVALLKPDRKLSKTAEIFQAKATSDYLKAGLLPYSLVVKRYANDGGPLSEDAKARIESLSKEAGILQMEFFGTAGQDSPEIRQKKNLLLVRINSINEEISKIQGLYADLYESTAEIKARSDTIEWWSVQLIYIDEDDKGLKPLFGSGSYESRIERLDELGEKNDEFYNEVIKRMSYLVSFWFTSRSVVTKVDFETMEQLYRDTMSTYQVKPKGGVDTTIAEVTPTTPVEAEKPVEKLII